MVAILKSELRQYHFAKCYTYSCCPALCDLVLIKVPKTVENAAGSLLYKLCGFPKILNSSMHDKQYVWWYKASGLLEKLTIHWVSYISYLLRIYKSGHNPPSLAILFTYQNTCKFQPNSSHSYNYTCMSQLDSHRCDHKDYIHTHQCLKNDSVGQMLYRYHNKQTFCSKLCMSESSQRLMIDLWASMKLNISISWWWSGDPVRTMYATKEDVRSFFIIPRINDNVAIPNIIAWWPVMIPVYSSTMLHSIVIIYHTKYWYIIYNCIQRTYGISTL